MRDAGIRPDNRSTLALVKLCRANGMPGVATNIMRERSRSPERNPALRRPFHPNGGNFNSSSASGIGPKAPRSPQSRI